MSEAPLITVITACYRDFSDLEATIRSVAEQDYSHIEHIITDDGSDPFPRQEIEALLQQYGDNAGVIHQRVNVGTVQNLNGAVAASGGEMICFLSCGDTFDAPDVLSRWAEHYTANRWQACLGLRRVVERPEDRTGTVLPTPPEQNKLTRFPLRRLYRDLCLGSYLSGSSMAYDGDFLRERRFDVDFRLLEDYPAALSLVRDGIRPALFPHVCIRHLTGGISSNTRLHPILVQDHDTLCRKYFTAPAPRFAAPYLRDALGIRPAGKCRSILLKLWHKGMLLLHSVLARF